MKNAARFNYFHCCILLLIQIISPIKVLDVSMLVNEKSMNNKVLDGGVMISVFSLTHCCSICGKVSCTGVFYNKELRICVPWRNSDTETTKNSVGWMYYPKQIPTVDFTSVSMFKMFEVPKSVTDVNSYIRSYCNHQGNHLIILESSFHHAILNQFIAWYINTNNIDVNQLVVAIDGRRGTGFNWYHSNGDLVKYFKWRPGQPDNSEFETQLMLWKYYMNDYWNNGYTLSIYPTLFVCDQTPLKEQQENDQDRK